VTLGFKLHVSGEAKAEDEENEDVGSLEKRG
jgi:hypothetical protein